MGGVSNNRRGKRKCVSAANEAHRALKRGAETGLQERVRSCSASHVDSSPLKGGFKGTGENRDRQRNESVHRVATISGWRSSRTSSSGGDSGIGMCRQRPLKVSGPNRASRSWFLRLTSSL